LILRVGGRSARREDDFRPIYMPVTLKKHGLAGLKKNTGVFKQFPVFLQIYST
jgi:hypothetical protein